MTEAAARAGTPGADRSRPREGGAERARREDRSRGFGSFRLSRWPGSRVLLVALAASALCWFIGADVWHSILLGSALTSLGLVGSMVLVANPGDTAWRGDDRRDRGGGASNDVARLSWSMRTSFRRVGNTAFSRVQELARRRLAAFDLDLGDPNDRGRIQELLGRRAYAVVAPGARPPRRRRSLLPCLDALDALDAAPLTQQASKARDRKPTTADHSGGVRAR